MWIFGYGSLIWDGWENKGGRQCVRAAWADLPGYRRIFNKRSAKNWGKRTSPCPTLNLEPAEHATCRGKAFEFPRDAKMIHDVLAYLIVREGCDPCELPLTIDGVGTAQALVYIHHPPTLIQGNLTPDELAKMAIVAKGSDGLCVNYIKGIAEKLSALGISDPAVVEMWRAVRAIT
jgi:cation transport protein ChaC